MLRWREHDSLSMTSKRKTTVSTLTIFVTQHGRLVSVDIVFHRNVDNYFDVSQCEAEVIRGYIIREEMMPLPLQNLSAHQPIRDRYRRKHWTVCCEQGESSRPSFRDGERKFSMIVVEDQAGDETGSAGGNVRTIADGVESESETDLDSLEEQDWCATDDEHEVMTGLREARKALQQARTSRRFCKKGGNRRHRATPNRSTSIQELKKVTTCSR